ncbi:hypothetical protein IA54_018375 [Xanthomonas phaseoli pv. syngonii LMG 9055]|uniref:Uncharacterized protein n=1 Tax=Xanthomonas phaseoli pv. syngonii LMG 9055 TaxID=1437878 RepID=A0A1V9HM81_9XANT|nr:hypothetical protein IA54_018375 [Xanthomonas phaseoli pv. syngonii LMG 9055]
MRAGMGAMVGDGQAVVEVNLEPLLEPLLQTRNWRRIEAIALNPEKESAVAAATQPQMAA